VIVDPSAVLPGAHDMATMLIRWLDQIARDESQSPTTAHRSKTVPMLHSYRPSSSGIVPRRILAQRIVGPSTDKEVDFFRGSVYK